MQQKAIGMTVDDAIFSGMLLSSLPSNERCDRLRAFVGAGMDCADTPEKVVAMTVTFDKVSMANEQWPRSFSALEGSSWKKEILQ
ncbi:unnamed protein product [Phytophthora fragariaefolia]|uniref:Unnamed protein product n=1 Tax=Phytophthora fragariaefolia TaxID=1490495 RepID=A0A9W6UEF0_9STRA|nr:unnamed protein product [Phytophthora fragariaefolia]